LKGNQWSETKFRRTKSWKSQPEYDKQLGDMSISSLRGHVHLKRKQLNYYKETHDLKVPENMREYQDMQQQLKMASDELVHREIDMKSTRNYEERFESETGRVLDSDGKIMYSIDFNETEDAFVIKDKEELALNNYEDDDNFDRKERTRKEIYQNWDYVTG